MVFRDARSCPGWPGSARWQKYSRIIVHCRVSGRRNASIFMRDRGPARRNVTVVQPGGPRLVQPGNIKLRVARIASSRSSDLRSLGRTGTRTPEGSSSGRTILRSVDHYPWLAATQLGPRDRRDAFVDGSSSRGDARMKKNFRLGLTPGVSDVRSRSSRVAAAYGWPLVCLRSLDALSSGDVRGFTAARSSLFLCFFTSPAATGFSERPRENSAASAARVPVLLAARSPPRLPFRFSSFPFSPSIRYRNSRLSYS